MAAAPHVEEPSPGRLFELGCVAAVLVVGFRTGLVPGGLVGVDLALALLGWWLGGAVLRGPSFGDRLRLGWRRLWPPVLAAIGLACAWVLVAPSTRFDDRVRGMALAALGGYGNWHLLAVGPAELARTRLATPLQSLWPMGVAVQLVAVLALLRWATRPRAARRHDQRDPLVVASLAVAVGAEVVVLVASFRAGGQGLLLATTTHAGAFFLGAAAGALAPGAMAATLRAVAHGTRWIAAAILAGVAVLGSPASTLYLRGAALAVPLLVAVLVVAEAPWPEPRSARRAAPGPVEGWAFMVAAWVVVGPALALARSAWPDLPEVATDLGGLAVAALVAYAASGVAVRLSDDRAAVDRRVVLVPPMVVLLLVLLFAATGAFHWASPRPRAGAGAAVTSLHHRWVA